MIWTCVQQPDHRNTRHGLAWLGSIVFGGVATPATSTAGVVIGKWCSKCESCIGTIVHNVFMYTIYIYVCVSARDLWRAHDYIYKGVVYQECLTKSVLLRVSYNIVQCLLFEQSIGWVHI